MNLAANVAGGHVLREANRRLRAESPGSDRSWRVGAEGEARAAEALAELTEVSRWDRVRGRASGWWVLHSVPFGIGNSDHVLGGPPGLFRLNSKHHRAARVEIGDESILVNRRPTEHVAKARLQAHRAARVLCERPSARRPARRPAVRTAPLGYCPQ